MATSSELPSWIAGPREFITPKEAAHFLCCSVDAIYDSLKAGPPTGIPGRKLYGTKRAMYRIPKHAFLKWAGFTTKDN
jgi:hypothetical protein